MKNTFISALLLFALAASFSAAALPELNPQKAWRPIRRNIKQKSASAVPYILNEKMAVCGNKKLLLNPDGKIVISNSASKIAEIIPFTAFTVEETGKIDWLPYNFKKCKVRFENGKVIWELIKAAGGKSYKVADQTLEIMPDGLLKLSGKFYASEIDGLKLRTAGSFFVTTPIAGNEGRKITFNDSKKLAVAKTLKHTSWREKNVKYSIYPDSPIDTLSIIAKKPEISTCGIFSVGKSLRYSFHFNKEKEGTIYIDLRTSSVEKTDSVNTGAGVNFKKIEDLELPYVNKNMMFNSSFEQDLIGWMCFYNFISTREFGKEKWNSNPFAIVKGGYHGNNAMRLKGLQSTYPSNYRHLTSTNISSPTVFFNPGKYTVSFYAKQTKGAKNCLLNVWCHNYNSGNPTIYLPPHKSGKYTAKLTRNWKRYSFTFVIPKAMPSAISFNVNGIGEVMLDAIQVEKGTRATAYTAPAAEGRLLTSAKDNFISAKEKVDAKVRIFTAPAAGGKVDIRVKNFFGEEVFKGTKSFKADKKGYAVVALPFENFGKGIFTVRFDYTLDNGRKSFDHTRFAVVDFLNNTHRLKNLFSEDFYMLEINHNFLKLLDRFRKVGLGAKSHMYNREKEVWDKYREFGIEPMSAFMVTNLRRPGTTKTTNFGLKYKRGTSSRTTDKDILIGDHNLSNNGEFDEAYLKKFSDTVAKIARKYRHIKRWAMQGEVRAKYPNEWWSKEGTEEEASRRHALYLKAFTEGVRRGNPDAQVFQDDPCNMRPDGGIAETGALLKNCNKHGIRFDLLAIHPYRFSPESPDLDSDTQLLFDTVRKQGYGDDVKIMWPEMMHWGPFNIPQWNTVSSTWGGLPHTWPGWVMSYDIGATEKLSAAWRARAWLVALKYSNRILTATSGGILNNFHMDEELTPYSSSLISNTLGNILGDSKFVKDIRFAPFCRAYVFTDQKNRPVAAVWCHLDKVDSGYIDAPRAEANFGNSLESVIDLMNNKRAFNAGKYQFPVTSFPIFLRGKPGTVKQMLSALEKAEIISGDGISPLEISYAPADKNNLKISFKNMLSRDFAGKFNGKKVVIPASGKASVNIPFARPLNERTMTQISMPGVFNAVNGQRFDYDIMFEAIIAKRISDSFTFKNINWDKLPRARFIRNMGSGPTSGNYSIAWNRNGIFIQAKINDKTFNHYEDKNTVMRWRNDCLQIYFDTMANGRFRQFKGYDEDDYDYALFPNSKGNSSIVWRNRSVEQQLGLATQAPPDQSIAADIPSSFSSKNGILTYRVFFPAKYLLPIRLREGWVFGFGLYAANVDVPRGRVISALTLADDGKACYNAPHKYPMVLLVD